MCVLFARNDFALFQSCAVWPQCTCAHDDFFVKFVYISIKLSRVMCLDLLVGVVRM